MGASYKEPVPGWIDNMNGITGLMIGAGKGVIRSMLCNADIMSDLIPCDMAVNATIALAWQVGMEKSTEPKFLNITTNQENPVSWGEVLEIGRQHIHANPFSRKAILQRVYSNRLSKVCKIYLTQCNVLEPLWYPGGRLTSSKVLHWFAVIFFQIIPAYLLDVLLIVTGNKPFLVRVQNKVHAGLELLQYYSMKQWIFW